MKKLVYLIFIFICIDLSFQRCANPGNPTGGPKDTIPPILINSIPKSGTTNFNSQEIILEFSEFVNADKLRQELIITPKTDITYKSIAKRNKLYIKLEEPLPDSTTYNFNFSEGVTDITEKNPAVNLSVAFSTGPFIDSLSINGSVEELMTKEAGEGFIVGLYPLTDTLNYFTQNPMYFTSSNEAGEYSIEYIKTGTYKILAFEDDNGNLLLDPETEQHGFLEQTIQLDTAIALPPIRCILQNVKPIELINARPAGPYVEIKFNKKPDQYTILPEYLYHNITGDNKDVIRIYKSERLNYNDSIESYITVRDSLGNQLSDTIKFVFLESNRKPSKFSISPNPTKLELQDSIKVKFQFNKPIKEFDSAAFNIIADSTFTYSIKHLKQIWNLNKTSLTATIQIDKDSLLAKYTQSLPKDTLTQDSTKAAKSAGLKRSSGNNLKLVIDPAAFISVENDSSKQVEIPLQSKKKQLGGTIDLTINTDYNSFTFQLISESGDVKYAFKNKKKFQFIDIKPDTYNIRVLIDEDNNGSWSYGNLLKNQEPEQVYLYPESTSVRENWVIELGISF